MDRISIEKNIFTFLFICFVALSCSEEDNVVDDSTNEPPEACFNMSTSTAEVGDEIEFTNCSSNATHNIWEFGDGNSSFEEEPTHTYSEQGEYEVKLEAGNDTNADGRFNQEESFDSVTNTVVIEATQE